MLKKLQWLQEKMERLMSERRPRIWLATPDLCLYLRQYPQFDWRYLTKIGARRGHLVVWLGWLGATVRW